MKKTTLFSSLAITIASIFLLSACTKQENGNTLSAPDVDVVQEDIILNNDETIETMTKTTESGLSESTETDDLQKELDATTIEEEDFSDL